MKINGTELNNFQKNFFKELMGDVFMPDVRAEATLNRLVQKYDVDLTLVADAINKNFAVKNAEFNKHVG